MTMRDQIIEIMDRIETTLLDKNAAYGNSAMDPVRIFSSSDATEQLKVRIDDKLSRLARGKNTDKVPEDTLMDLIGYLVLLVIAQEREDESVKTTDSWVSTMNFTMVPSAELDHFWEVGGPSIYVVEREGKPREEPYEPGDEVTVHGPFEAVSVALPSGLIAQANSPLWDREHP